MHSLQVGSIVKLRLFWKIKGEVFCGLFLKKRKKVTFIECKILWNDPFTCDFVRRAWPP